MSALRGGQERRYPAPRRIASWRVDLSTEEIWIFLVLGDLVVLVVGRRVRALLRSKWEDSCISARNAPARNSNAAHRPTSRQ